MSKEHVLYTAAFVGFAAGSYAVHEWHKKRSKSIAGEPTTTPEEFKKYFKEKIEWLKNHTSDPSRFADLASLTMDFEPLLNSSEFKLENPDSIILQDTKIMSLSDEEYLEATLLSTMRAVLTSRHQARTTG